MTVRGKEAEYVVFAYFKSGYFVIKCIAVYDMTGGSIV